MTTPVPFTSEQWSRMFTASLQAEIDAHQRTRDEIILRIRVYSPPTSL